VAGVLFASLFFGHFSFKVLPGAQSVGFALFILSVGYQAGSTLMLAGIIGSMTSGISLSVVRSRQKF